MQRVKAMPLEGDYSGRGTWANGGQHCAFVYRTFRGKRWARSLQPPRLPDKGLSGRESVA